MTPAQVENAARSKYNATGDTFYSSSEILDYIYQAQLEMTQVCDLIEAIYTTDSVQGQAKYSYPAYTVKIKRVTYNGRKLQPATFRDDDTITGLDAATTDTGTPEEYEIHDNNIYLRPTPDANAMVIRLFSVNQPAPMTASSSIEVPSLFHMDIVDFVVSQMAAKDENVSVSQHYEERWEKAKERARVWTQKRKRGDAFAVVQAEEQHAYTQFGSI